MVTILQPLIAPLHGGKSIHEVLAFLDQDPTPSAYELVRGYWQGQTREQDFPAWWRRALHDGVVPNTGGQPKAVSLRTEVWRREQANGDGAPGALEVLFQPDPTI